MQGGSVVLNAAAVAAVNLVVIVIVGGLLKSAVERWVSRRDKRHDELQEEVARLRDVRVAGVERSLKDHSELDDVRHREAKSSRAQMHEQIAVLDRDTIKRAECRENHEGFIGQVQELARVGERVDGASKRNDELFNRMIGMKGDIERLTGRLEKLGGQS